MHFTDILVKNGFIGQGKLAKVITQSEEDGIALEKALKAEGVSGKIFLTQNRKFPVWPLKKFCRAKFLLRRLRKYRKRRRVIIVLFLWALKTVFWRSALLTRTTLKRKGPCNLLFPE